jgi:hypothetical protein
MGDCLIWAVFWKLPKWPTFLGYFAIILTKMVRATFWAIFFTNSSGPPGLIRDIWRD